VLTISASVQTILGGHFAHAVERDAIRFQVVDSMDEGSARGLYGGPYAGVIRPLLTWTRKPVAETALG
jgi:hypothetical protein